MDSSTLHRLYLFSSESLWPTEWDLDGTMLHYLAVWKSMVSIHKPVHLKLHTLPDKLIAVYPGKMALKALLTTRWPFLRLCWNLFVRKNCRNRLLLKKHGNVYCQLHNYVCGHINNPPTLNLPSLYPYVTHMIKYSRPSTTTFPYCKEWKLAWGLGIRHHFGGKKSSAIERVYYLSHAYTMWNTVSAMKMLVIKKPIHTW